MKKRYFHVIQRVWLVLFWAGMGQTVWAQSIPDSQWARLGTTLAITTDGNIVTTEFLSFSPNGPGPFVQSGDRLIKYTLQGDQIWSTGLLKGGFYIGGKLPGIDYEAIRNITASAATANGGVTVAGPLNVRGGENVAVSVSANGTFNPWSDGDIFNSFVSEDIPRDLVNTPDGGFIVLYSITQANAPSKVIIRRYGAGLVSTKEIAYPNPTPGNPDRTLTRGRSIINTPDGGYLIAGYVNMIGSNSPEAGWVAKLDKEGNVSWQKLLTGLPISYNFNGPLPGSIVQMLSVTDVILAADGNGYALVGTAVEPTKYPAATPAILELNADGSFKRARSVGGSPTESFITLYTGSGGKKYYAVGNTSLQNGTDPQISLVNPTTLPLNDPALFNVDARRTFDGPSDGSLLAIGTAGDGGLVFASSANQVVKLVPETTPPGGALVLTQPTYNCQTGAITFNTSGGDGSPITYSAPGISRASATSNSGTVEPGLRNDPKLITITATQNGQTASYAFDLKAACNGSQPPVVTPPTPPTPPRVARWP